MLRIIARRAPRASVLFALVLVLAAAPHARASAADSPDVPDEGPRKVISYARCALNVFLAVTPVQWTAAILDCSRLYLSEPPLPGSQP